MRSQKQVEKVLPSRNISKVEIEALSAYKVVVSTVKKTDITIKARMNGAYQEQLYIVSGQEGKALRIKAELTPLFQVPDDKLSAHKVLSVVITVELPENMSLHVVGADTELQIRGKYDEIVTKTRSEKTLFQNTVGRINAYSFKGDLFYITSKGQIEAVSEYGVVCKDDVPTGNDVVVLKTVHGNIYISKNE
ncbi:hypothetical protein MQE36_03740 [Zhouia spongiae]|uniref:Adhesin domain-containing protein n=1 Tax=Zhouia spongiae TaxID=2202721 RepID=A0ABY3YPB1_9FLAO|nr:hypothetical protein [Zhouia spongiae]UNY99460.1 hypothetical protein MQE36_03740 [Zhouia spongiae]